MELLQKVTLTTAVALSLTAAAAAGPAYAEQPSAGPAQGYPSKPIRVIVPFTPGGTSDVLARIIAVKLGDDWGQPVVIENRTGAGGTIGTNMVAKSAPDGYTLLISSAAFAISAAIHQNLPYDAVKDFSGITRLGYSTNALIVPAGLGVKSTKELIALAQAKPGQLIFSSAGVGSSTHMNGERFRLAAGIKVKHVGFKGASDAMLEVVAGRVHYALLGLASSLSFIRDGRLIALGVGTPERSPLLPDVPTLAEAVPGFARDGSHSLLAPAGTPRAIREKISKEVKHVLELPDVKQRFEGIDFVAAPTTPEEHERIVRADIQTFSGVVTLAGLRPK